MIPYQTAVQLVCGEMQCSKSSFYRYYHKLLRPYLARRGLAQGALLLGG